MQNKVRILFVGAFPSKDSPVIGGIITSCRVLMDSSITRKAKIILVDSTQLCNPPPGIFTRIIMSMRRVLVYVYMFEKNNAQVVCLFMSKGASALEKGLMAWYAKFRSCPAILFPRGNPMKNVSHISFGRRMYNKIAYAGASRIVCQGKAWQDYAVNQLGFKVTDTPIVVNWTATSELLEIGKERVCSYNEYVNILYLGWVEEEKGIYDLLRACYLLSKEIKYRLNIVGDGHALKTVHQLICEYGLQDKVKCCGWVRGEEKLDELRTADIFVLPSWSEGLPNSMIEAMACRVACLVTSVGNIPSVFNGKNAAVLVPARKVDILSIALNRLIKDARYRCLIANNGYHMALKEFSVEKAVDKIMDITQSVLTENGESAISSISK